MGYHLRRVLGNNYQELSRERIEEVAEGALIMQEALARDVLAFVEMMGMPEEIQNTDQRVTRAKETIRLVS